MAERVRVPIYPTRNLATEIDPGAREILPGTNITFTTAADGTITINAPGALGGTVTSVGASGSTGLTIGGTNPVTTSGTITFTLSANLQAWSGVTVASKANLAGPAFTGVPTAPTAAPGTNTTQLATTAFVQAAAGNYVLKTGDTMSGALQVNSTITSNNVITSTGGIVRAQGFGGASDSGVYYFGNAALDNWIYKQSGTNSLQFRFGSPAVQATLNTAGTILTDSSTIASGYVRKAGDTMTGNLIVAGADMYSYRAGGTTGVVFLNSAGTRYVYFNGANYVMPGSALNLDSGVNLGSGGRLLSKVSLGTAAPGALANGELYLRY